MRVSTPGIPSPNYFERHRSEAKSAYHPLAGMLLWMFIVAIAISPRLRIERVMGDLEAVDLRFQDLLLMPMLAFVFFDWNRGGKSPLWRLYGWWLPAMLWGILLVMGVTTLLDPDVSALRRLGYGGRAIQLFVIAEVVARLFVRAGNNRLRLVLSAVVFSVGGNIAWFGYQLAVGETGTLLGSEVASTVSAYGPKLIGEPSAFGTGQFFMFAGAAGVAVFRTGIGPKYLSLFLMICGVIGTVLSESRVSFIVLLVIILLMFSVSLRPGHKIRPLGVLAGIALSAAIAFYSIGNFGNRMSSEGLAGSMDVRAISIWEPAINLIIAHPFWGVGPGGLLKSRGWPDEAHNIVLRAALDFGLLFGTMFLGMFLKALQKSRRAMDVSPDQTGRMFASMSFVGILGVLASGVVQDSLTAVMSTHLLMLAIGLYAGSEEVSARIEGQRNR